MKHFISFYLYTFLLYYMIVLAIYSGINLHSPTQSVVLIQRWECLCYYLYCASSCVNLYYHPVKRHLAWTSALFPRTATSIYYFL